MAHDIVILGVFVADAVFRASRLPVIGETLIGSGFALGPGGKGSNQAVAAAKAGGDVGFITRLGADDFGDMAARIWADAGVHSLAHRDPNGATGAAFVFVNDKTGENAIIISPGAAKHISPADLDTNAAALRDAKVVMTQLEQPLPAAQRALELAKSGGARTILNPAPAPDHGLSPEILALCDFVTPNETEAAAIIGTPVTSIDSARAAGKACLERGVGTAAIITLGEGGSLWVTRDDDLHVPAMFAGAVVDTTGAGDAFNGGFAVALAEGRAPADALRFATATAALSVTRHGTAAAMPVRAEIVALLTGG